MEDKKMEETRSSILASSQEVFRGIEIKGHTDTWSSVDTKAIDDKTFFLMENDEYGDDAAFLIIDEDRKLIFEDVYDGFDEPAFLKMFPQIVPIRQMKEFGTVGRINFLNTDGTIGYTTDYNNAQKMNAEITESMDCGRPISVEWDIEQPKRLITDMDFFELQEHLWLSFDLEQDEAADLASAIKAHFLERTGEQERMLVDFWNSHNNLGMTYHVYLGMSESDYVDWVNKNNIGLTKPIENTTIEAKIALLYERLETENNNLLAVIDDHLPKNEFMEYAPMLVRSAEMKDIIENMLACDMLNETEIDGLLMEKNILNRVTSVCMQNNIYDIEERVGEVVSNIATANIERQIKQNLFQSTTLNYEIKSVVNDFSNQNCYERLKLLCDYITQNPEINTLQVCDIADTISDLDKLNIMALPQEDQISLLNKLTKERVGEAEKFCLNTEHCIPQKNINLTNQFIILKPQVLRGEYRSAENQVCFATGGFGCAPDARGRAVFTENIFDGSKARWNTEDILGIADNDKLPDYIQGKISSFEITNKNIKLENLNTEEIER